MKLMHCVTVRLVGPWQAKRLIKGKVENLKRLARTLQMKPPFERGVLMIRQELNESVLPIFRRGNLKLIELLTSLTLEPQKNM